MYGNQLTSTSVAALVERMERATAPQPAQTSPANDAIAAVGSGDSKSGVCELHGFRVAITGPAVLKGIKHCGGGRYSVAYTPMVRGQRATTATGSGSESSGGALGRHQGLGALFPSALHGQLQGQSPYRSSQLLPTAPVEISVTLDQQPQSQGQHQIFRQLVGVHLPGSPFRPAITE